MRLALEQHTIENSPITLTSPKPRLSLSVHGELVQDPSGYQNPLCSIRLQKMV